MLDNQYEQKSEVLYTFRPNKSYAYLLNVETSNIELDEIITTFTHQNGRQLEKEGKFDIPY